eukprot:7715-Heterococcus_DN1.PRE.2
MAGKGKESGGKGGSGGRGGEKKSVSKSARAGLQFPVGRVGRCVCDPLSALLYASTCTNSYRLSATLPGPWCLSAFAELRV